MNHIHLCDTAMLGTFLQNHLRMTLLFKVSTWCTVSQQRWVHLNTSKFDCEESMVQAFYSIWCNNMMTGIIKACLLQYCAFSSLVRYVVLLLFFLFRSIADLLQSLDVLSLTITNVLYFAVSFYCIISVFSFILKWIRSILDLVQLLFSTILPLFHRRHFQLI